MSDEPLPSRSGAATARNVARLGMRAWRVRVTGLHHVPVDGPVLLAANHLGALDGPLLVAASPRPVHVLAKSELFVAPVDRLLRAGGQVEIEYDGPDRSALHLAVRLLADGRAVGVFPEGHRGRGDVAHARHGLAYLAAGGVPVVPVAVLGTRGTGSGRDSTPRPGARLDVVYGEPVVVRADGDVRRRAVLARAGEQLRQVLADHVERSCRRTGQVLPADDVRRDAAVPRVEEHA